MFAIKTHAARGTIRSPQSRNKQPPPPPAVAAASADAHASRLIMQRLIGQLMTPSKFLHRRSALHCSSSLRFDYQLMTIRRILALQLWTARCTTLINMPSSVNTSDLRLSLVMRRWTRIKPKQHHQLSLFSQKYEGTEQDNMHASLSVLQMSTEN